MPTTWEALSVILLAVVPGFITTTMWARARTWKGYAGDLRVTLQSLALSAVIQVLLSPLTIHWIVPAIPHPRMLRNEIHIAIWFALAVLVIPVVLGFACARGSDRLFRPIRRRGDREQLGWFRRSIAWLIEASPLPSVWDAWLADHLPDEGIFVRVTFRDGHHVGGAFAASSQAFTSPERQGLFIEQEWVLDDAGNLQEVVPGSLGMLIPSIDEVRAVSILGSGSPAREHEAPSEDEDGGQEKTR
jgi:hypothetical protein